MSIGKREKHAASLIYALINPYMQTKAQSISWPSPFNVVLDKFKLAILPMYL